MNLGIEIRTNFMPYFKLIESSYDRCKTTFARDPPKLLFENSAITLEIPLFSNWNERKKIYGTMHEFPLHTFSAVRTATGAFLGRPLPLGTSYFIGS